MSRILRSVAAALVALSVAGGAVAAQTPQGTTTTAPAHDPSARLKEVLPADVAARILARIADARAHELPAQALENRALKFASRGEKPEDVEKAVAEHADRLQKSKDALEAGRGTRPSDEEVEAGAEALRQGVDGSQVSAFAKAAPHDRPLAVALYVIGSLVNRKLPADDALKAVLDRLNAKASDAELEKLPRTLPAQAAEGQSHKPAAVGRDLAATKRPGGAAAGGGPPSGVPANGGAAVRPSHPGAVVRP